MLHLVTGVPGSGKTLSVIDHVIKQTSDGGPWEKRQVFYFNIDNCVVPGWQELTEEQAHEWYELPTGAIIIIDEAQQLYPPKDWKTQAADGVSRLDTHRHHGFDLIFITQHPKLLHAGVRRMVGLHWDLDRRHGQELAKRYVWSACSDNPRDWNSRKDAVTEPYKFPKHIYEYYKSAEVHTHKRKYPLKLIGALCFVLAIPVIGLLTYYNFSPGAEELVEQSEARPGPSLFDGVGNHQNEITLQEYLEARQPRTQGLPHTAPLYDELTEPQDYPRYNCVASTQRTETCKCYSQQGTLYKFFPIAKCLDIVENGYLDLAKKPTKPFVPGVRRAGTSTVAIDSETGTIPPELMQHKPTRAILLEYDGPGRIR